MDQHCDCMSYVYYKDFLVGFTGLDMPAKEFMDLAGICENMERFL
jgi:hypothetical protein